MNMRRFPVFEGLAFTRSTFVCHRRLRRQQSGVKRGPQRPRYHARALYIDATVPPHAPISLRKQLKEEAKARRLSGERNSKRTKPPDQYSKDWELTVGIEIHAALNTERKLFSPALTSSNDVPNSHVSVFDVALPGTQPQFQKETLIPALRAALALNCEIQRKSSWDRKHYFWWDQPNGYQITQYYHPLAVNGHITLYPYDDIDPTDSPDGQPVTIGIKQIQMEQDTAKTVLQPPSTHLLDFNRVGHPLIEIITLPQIHSARTAAALVKKIQSVLKAVGANTTGMELGGLRADVNVSVKKRSVDDTVPYLKQSFEYAGVVGLGQRTEIKNLSSFKAVEDAIVAEQSRQIEVLEAGDTIEGETRGWTLGSTETRRLRGKEGEVDYRYMPDPDLGAVIIREDLIAHLKHTLPLLPDQLLEALTASTEVGGCDLTLKDAKTLVAIDEGDRLEYYFDVVDILQQDLKNDFNQQATIYQRINKIAANWVLHEVFGPLLAQWSPTKITSATLAYIIRPLLRGEITTFSAKHLLRLCADSDIPTLSPEDSKALVSSLIDQHDLRLTPMTDAEYQALARTVVDENDEMAKKARDEWAREVQSGRGKSRGKIMWFVGQLVRRGEKGCVQPERAEEAIRKALGL